MKKEKEKELVKKEREWKKKRKKKKEKRVREKVRESVREDAQRLLFMLSRYGWPIVEIPISFGPLYRRHEGTPLQYLVETCVLKSLGNPELSNKRCNP